jgi:hypothetical protein
VRLRRKGKGSRDDKLGPHGADSSDNNMNSRTTSNFEIAARHIGWGDPAENGLFFVGIEETLHWRQQELDRYRKQQASQGKLTWDPCVEEDTSDDRKRTKTRIPYWTASIASQVCRSGKDRDSYQRTLWQPDTQVFNANLLPLGKLQTSAWPDGYEALFGWKREDRPQYLVAVTQHRYPALREFWKERKPAATVCFGKGYWPEFKAAFELQGNGAVAGNGRLRFFEREHFVLAPFFGYWHMTETLAVEIGMQLKGWSVNIA